ncbi:amino acid permease [Cantharellus anzutake]|uniref:amino acid permease n=1 Tax=Cantharellus anzutake TaxID=1750568 RepID=UPI0019033F73|nr:amino acid permease [Cantharellus anzutake]KAF8334137.1 amino acid permease [Cantharellus anzutake]
MGKHPREAKEKVTPTTSNDGATELGPDGASHVQGHLKRQLKSRHIAMIRMYLRSIGGVIGTGLFLGTGTALSHGGPVGLLLGYSIMGSICYSTMISLGEMIAYLPIAGGHIKLAERFVGKFFSFSMGWNYWYNWVIVLPAELSAAAILIDYWEHHSILGIVLDLGGGPNRDRLGFRYWVHPGPFVQFHGIKGSWGRFLGFWTVLTQAAFSFIGTEIVAIAAGEAKNPRRNIPKAIKRVYIRILLFYIGGTATIGLLVPSNDKSLGLTSDAASSPFVIAIKRAGIGGLPSTINAALLTSALSAASSDLYTSSRALYGLAIAGNAPKIFTRTSKSGLPYFSVFFCALFCCLAYLDVSSGSGKVFGWFTNMTSIAGLMTWFGINFTYWRFYQGMKAQGFDRSKLPFIGILQPYAAWYAMIWIWLVCIFAAYPVFLRNNWDTATFITYYSPLALFPVMVFGTKFWYKETMIAPGDMDFYSGLAEIEADSYDEPPPANWIERFWSWLM